MLVVEVVDKTHVNVIHHTYVEVKDEESEVTSSSGTLLKPHEICEKVVELDPGIEEIEEVHYTKEVKPFSGPEAIERGRQEVKETKGNSEYNLIYNNCECFVNMCLIDQKVSNQGEKFVEGAKQVGLVTALVVGIGLVYRYLTKGQKGNEDMKSEKLEEKPQKKDK